MLRVQQLEHFALLNDEHGGRSNRRSRPHANGLPRQTAITKKSPGPRMATIACLQMRS